MKAFAVVANYRTHGAVGPFFRYTKTIPKGARCNTEQNECQTVLQDVVWAAFVNKVIAFELRYGCIVMYLILFYVAITAGNGYVLHSVAFQQPVQSHRCYYNKHQRRTTAKPLIVDRFDCSNDIVVLPNLHSVNTLIPHREGTDIDIAHPKSRDSHSNVIGTFEPSRKDSDAMYTLDRGLESIPVAQLTASMSPDSMLVS